MNVLLNVRRDDPETTVSVVGEIDLGSGQRLLEYALAVIRQHGPRLAVDLAGVTFMDCGGVRVLLAIRARAHRLGGYLSVVAASGAVRRVLEILGLDRIFAIPEQPEVNSRIVRSFNDGTTSRPLEWAHPHPRTIEITA